MIRLAIFMLLVLANGISVAHAQIYRCPAEKGMLPEYVNNATTAKARQCVPISAKTVSPAAQPPSSGQASRVTRSRRSEYEIETSHNDELFIINGEKFEAQTYCFNMKRGDKVLFLDGSPLGACASATLLNLRTRNKCEVWCE